MDRDKNPYISIVEGNRDDTHLVGWQPLFEFAKRLFMTLDVPEEDSATMADCLVEADLCGVPSHGVSRIAIYLKRLEMGGAAKTFNPVIEKEYPGSVLLNANNAGGMVVGKYATLLACKKARESGSCMVFVNNTNHLAMVGYYPRLAAEEGFLGFATTSANPGIAPWGSKEPFLGTSPIAIAVPTWEDPVILDMSPSVVAMGKVMLSAKLGVSIPEGWAIDEEGQPTTDAQKAAKGSVLPIGGPKGSGLSLFSQILGGIISGAQYGPHVNPLYGDVERPQEMGQLFAAVDISKIIDLDVFKDRMAQLISEIKSLPRIEGVDEILLPGELEMRRRRQRKAEGIRITDVVYRELAELGKQYNVAFNL